MKVCKNICDAGDKEFYTVSVIDIHDKKQLEEIYEKIQNALGKTKVFG